MKTGTNTNKGLALPKVDYKLIVGKRKGLGADVILSTKNKKNHRSQSCSRKPQKSRELQS